MKGKALKVLSLLIMIIGSTLSLSIQAGNDLPNSMSYEGVELILNGQGTRSIVFVKIYESGLYLNSENNNGEEIINQDSAMAIRLQVLSSFLTDKQMKNTIDKAFVKSTKGNTEPIAGQISQFMAALNKAVAVGDVVAVGDIYEFIYLPQSGLHVRKNAKHLDTIAGLDFKKAFFGIWLSEAAVQDSLKNNMLGN